MTAENYHLKWDSHLSYLNSSVATLYKNEKFADVVLFSSSTVNGNGNTSDVGIPTVGISAHKFILSSCSQFFATMFETAPISAPNGVLNVVLPPDLSHRAIQILVQYMYSGEATVSNDILSEVLRGGEILKIRGLCRASTTHHHHHHNHQHHQQQQQQRETNNGNAAATATATHYGTNGTRTLASTVAHGHLTTTSAAEMFSANKCTRYSNIEHAQHTQQQFRGLGASVLPKDSPVIVKSPKMPQTSLLATTSKLHAAPGSISVNKEVAIDPEDKCCYQLTQHEVNMPATICNEIGCNSCPMSADVTEQLRRRQQAQNDDLVPPTSLAANRLERSDYVEHAVEQSSHCERDELPPVALTTYERHLRRESSNERARDYFVPDINYDHPPNANAKQFLEPTLPKLSPPTLAHNFLNIKQEPADWSSSVGTENSSDILNRPPSPIQSPKQPLDFKMPLGGAAVKLEAITAHNTEDDEESAVVSHGNDYGNFSHLVCEVCKKGFDDPKIWVRHLETHSVGIVSNSRNIEAAAVATSSCSSSSVANGENVAKPYVPKKRRRVSQQDNGIDHVTLLCDLCSTSFETPAEWVRHMNNQHTEIELALFNSKKDNEVKIDATSASSNVSNNNHHQQSAHKRYINRGASLNFGSNSEHGEQRTCDICNKRFSSPNQLLIHKRSHHAPNGSLSGGAVVTANSSAATVGSTHGGNL